MKKLQLALPALFLIVLFAPNFVSAEEFEDLMTSTSVGNTVEHVEEIADTTKETVREHVENSTLAKPVTNTVDSANEVVETASTTERTSKPVQQVIEKTKGTIQETTTKVEEKVVEPVKEKVVEPVGESLVKPVKETVEAVEERIDVFDAVEVVEDTVSKTEEKLEELPIEQVVKEEEQPETSYAKRLDGNVSAPHDDNQVGGKESEDAYSVAPNPVMEADSNSQVRNGPIEKESDVKKDHQPINQLPLSENRSINNQAITAQTVQVGTPSVTPISSTELGVSAFLESLRLDFAAVIQWSNPEEAGKSQWSHAPPGEPPKSLSFLNDVNNI